jgi:hypothetical protein
MAKYCKFINSLYKFGEMIWEIGNEYKVTFETDDVYFFGEPIENGISKKYEGKLFVITER